MEKTSNDLFIGGFVAAQQLYRLKESLKIFHTHDCCSTLGEDGPLSFHLRILKNALPESYELPLRLI